ncbi:hypothetical protein ACFQ23_04565, partial [Schaalia naturae]
MDDATSTCRGGPPGPAAPQTSEREGPGAPEEALRAPHHLACVEGPDIGAVAALTGEVLLGREGDPTLRDPRVSRRHALVRPA